MSDYSSLKATINANIKANNNHEITGAITNSVLNAMVNSLGAGYQFIGVATPTNPGSAQTPDYKCFYLATTPGTYTNLGGLVVADGEVALLKYDTSWTKEVSGIATSEQVSQLGQERIPYNKDYTDSLVYHSGYIQENTGAVIPSQVSQYSDFIKVVKGTIVMVTTASTGVGVIFCKDDSYSSQRRVLVASDSGTPKTYTYTASGDMEIGVCGVIADMVVSVNFNNGLATRQELNEGIETLADEVDATRVRKNKDYTALITYHPGYIHQTSGAVISSQVSQYSDFINVVKGTRVTIKTGGDSVAVIYCKDESYASTRKPLVVSDGASIDDVKTYTYIAAEDMEVGVCGAIANMVVKIIYENEYATKEYATYKYTPKCNHIFCCRDGQVSSTAYPPDTKYAIKATADNQYDFIRFTVQKTTDNYYILCHDATINNLARNSDGTVISETIKPDETTFAVLDSYDWGIAFGSQFAGMGVPTLENALYYAALYNIGVYIEMRFNPTADDAENIIKLLSKYGIVDNILIYCDYPIIDKYKLFVDINPNISCLYGVEWSIFLERIESLKTNLLTGRNSVYVGFYPKILNESELYTVVSNGFKYCYTRISGFNQLLTDIGFSNGVSFFECADIPYIKDTIKEYVDELI